MSSSYRHHVPGRLRVRSERIKNRPTAAAAVESLIAAAPGVQRVKGNTITGSVTVNYEPSATTAAAILDLLQTHGYIQDCSLPPYRHVPAGDLTARIGSRVAKALAEKALERAFAALIAAAL
jgi:hypothetical protein